METFRPKLILAPTDFSETAAHALRYASALGERLNAHLLVMYADPFMPAVDFTAIAASSFDLAQQNMIEEAREKLEVHAQENVRKSVPYDVRVIIGSPVIAISEVVRETGADLIVMGTHGRTGLRRILFGSVTSEVIRLAPAPVIAVNSATPETAEVRRVLVPVTSEPRCHDALPYAAALTSAPDTPFVFLQFADDDRPLEDTLDRLISLQQWAPNELGDRCEFKIMPLRDADRSIASVAKFANSDLIAVTIPEGHGLGDVLRVTLAERVIRQSGCPVLTVNSLVARCAKPTAALVG
jgi:nucleotide-binding universal stress UspA family protein